MLAIATSLSFMTLVVATYSSSLANQSVWLSATASCGYKNYTTHTFKGPIANFKLSKVLYNQETSTEGYVGYDSTHKQIWVVFRGTDDYADWLNDGESWMNDFSCVSDCNDCKVHHGFNKCFESVRDDMYNAVVALVKQYSDYSLIVTGHSLGGAMALLGALYLEQYHTELGKSPTYYSFGSPKVGNDNFASFAETHITNSYRVTHFKDTVPHLPLAFYYHHVTTEIYENQNHQLHTCVGESDADCCQQFPLYELSFDDHVLYLNLSMNCAAVS